MKNYFYNLLVVLLLSPFSLQAQIIETNGKPNSGVDYTRLRRIDTLIDNYISKKQLTGAVTIIVKDNQLVQYKGYGYLDIDAKKPMPNDAIFRIMSQTKAITSVGIMILYEQGKL